MLLRKVKDLFKFIKAYFSVKYQHGMKRVSQNDNEFSVTCLVKNGDYYIRQFIEHYKALGCKHIFLLDNMSSDDTINIAKRYNYVSVYSTKLNVGAYQRFLKKSIVLKTINTGWCLDVDIDEFFDYPYSDRITIKTFLNYMNRYKYNCIVTQMLDMFSDKPMRELKNDIGHDIKKTYRKYDISNVRKEDYRKSSLSKYSNNNDLKSKHVKLYFGGIRKTLYGLDCLLTKHSFFSRNNRIDVFPHVHFMNNARIADITCVLFHYKFTVNAYDDAIQNRDNFSGTSDGYKRFLNILGDIDSFVIDGANSQVFSDCNNLVDDGFLIVSKKFKILKR